MTRGRAAATLLLAHVVLFIVTTWAAAIGPRPVARGPVRLEQTHTVALVAAKPVSGDDLARRDPAPPLAVPSSTHPLGVPPAPSGEHLGSAWRSERPPSAPLLLATARGPPQAT